MTLCKRKLFHKLNESCRSNSSTILGLNFFPIIECGGTFTDEEGSCQTPRYPEPYPANIECEWIITVPVTHSLTLTFDAFGVEDSSKCKYDYVEIRDGATDSSTLIG